MNLFKIFERFNSEKKLPSKEYLYEEFYRRSSTENPPYSNFFELGAIYNKKV